MAIRKSLVLQSKGEAETRELGRRLGAVLREDDVVALDGDLGAGKTQFTMGLCAALGVTDMICSPTFLLVNEYHSGRFPVFHFDAYRLSGAEELEEIGWDDYRAKGVTIVEWALRVAEILPENRIAVEIRRRDEISPNLREICITMDERMDCLVNLSH